MKATVLIGLIALAAACGRPGEPAGRATPDEPVSSTPSDGSPAPGEPEAVTPRPGMARVRAIPWERAEPHDHRVTVVFWSGVEPCHVLDHVEVVETAETVTITLYEGHDPDAGQVACIELAVEKQTTVMLEDPVGGRELMDGAS